MWVSEPSGNRLLLNISSMDVCSERNRGSFVTLVLQIYRPCTKLRIIMLSFWRIRYFLMKNIIIPLSRRTTVYININFETVTVGRKGMCYPSPGTTSLGKIVIDTKMRVMSVVRHTWVITCTLIIRALSAIIIIITMLGEHHKMTAITFDTVVHMNIWMCVTWTMTYCSGTIQVTLYP